MWHFYNQKKKCYTFLKLFSQEVSSVYFSLYAFNNIFKNIKNKADNQNLKKWTGSLSYLFTIFYNEFCLCFLSLGEHKALYMKIYMFLSPKYLLKDNVVLDPNKNSKLQDIFSWGKSSNKLEPESASVFSLLDMTQVIAISLHFFLT